MPAKVHEYRRCEVCDTRYLALRANALYCGGTCRKRAHDARQRKARTDVQNFSLREVSIAALIRDSQPGLFKLIVLARRHSLTAGRLTLWATWLANYPEDVPPQDIFTALKAVELKPFEVPLLTEV